MSDRKLKVGVLVSGRGSNLQSLLDAIQENRLSAEIVVVISNKADAYALERAQKAGIPTEVLPFAKGSDREIYDQNLIARLESYNVDLIVLAGFMRILTKTFISSFHNRIINIHPSLLPAFPGLHAQKQALDYGVRVSGCTVHFVDEGCDTGPIILQATVPVMPNDTEDTLSARILKEEHRLLPKAIDLYDRNKVKIVNKKIVVEE